MSAPLADVDREAEASSLLDAALALAASGTPVFPCNADKRPAIAKGKGGDGFHNASTDPDRIRELWHLAGPAAKLVGVPTGAASGFDVLDTDPRHGGHLWEQENLPRLPETEIHQTPGGGHHHLFVHVEGVRNIQDGKTIAPGVDVRGQGGYVCFPPSPGYQVIHEAEVAPWPDWLLPLVIKVAEPPPRPDPSSYATPARVSDNRLRGFIDREVRRVRDAPQGGRHGARLAAARSIGGVAAEAGLSDTEVEEMLIAARSPEVEEMKERRTIRDGLAYGRAAPIDLNALPDNVRGYQQHRGNGAAPSLPDVPPPEWDAEPRADWGARHPPTSEEATASADVLEAIKQLGPDLTLPALISLFNETYAVVNEGGKALVMWTAPDPQMRRDRIERATFDDFKKFYSNNQFTVTVTADGKPKKITKTFAAWWLDHPNRRQYLAGVLFDPAGKAAPGSFNLWRGWSIPPAPGDWSLMAAHVHNVICGGRSDICSYVTRWLAHMIQHPDQPAEVAIVMRGAKGIGKGIFGKWLLRLCGQHGLHIINAAHLTGHFTGHLRDVIFVFADEALYAGDKQHEGILKGIITEGSLLIEAKYRTAVMVANMLHLILSSNNDWVVPASHDERRYLMLDVLSQHQRDFAYFSALDAQMENGGLAAMLHDLATMDLGAFRPREVPDTPELADQKLLSLDTPERWWMTVLARGFVWKSRYGHKEFLAWDDFVTTELLNRSYAQWCQENRVPYPAHRTALGRMLAAIYAAYRPRAPHPVYEADSVDPQDPQPVVKLPNQHGYRLGTLDNARTRFRDARGLTTVEWDEETAP